MSFSDILFSSSDVSGCGWIRSYLPSKHLEAQFIGGFSLDISLNGINKIIFQRHTHPDFMHIIPHLKSLGKKIYYDLDDDLWTIEETNPAKLSYTKSTLECIEKIISICDGVFTSTEYLKNKLTRFNSNVMVVPNLIEIPTTTKEIHNKIRIGYAGSTSHVGDFSDKLIYTCKKLFNKYNDKIAFVFLGYIPPQLKEFSFFYQGVEPNYYIDVINHLDFDIALIPLSDNEFNKSKSNLKWLDSSICKAVPLVSDVLCYSEVIDGENGIIVKDELWYDRLEWLINNRDEMEILKLKSYDHVLQNYTWLNAKYKQEEVYKDAFGILT